MGYRSEVALKTTTEGWVIIQKMNNMIEDKYSKPLMFARVEATASGFYKISFSDIKWYDSYEQVRNFTKALDVLDEQDIPYSFIRLGEDVEDIERRQNISGDCPSEIYTFEPYVTIDDCDTYEEIIMKGDD